MVCELDDALVLVTEQFFLEGGAEVDAARWWRPMATALTFLFQHSVRMLVHEACAAAGGWRFRRTSSVLPESMLSVVVSKYDNSGYW